MYTSISDLSGTKFQYFVNDDMARSSIGKNKEWEPHITQFVKLYNSFYSLTNIIDVGANFGYHSVLFSKEVKGNIYSFEPQGQNYELLKNNISINNRNNIMAYNLGCGDINCDISMPIIDTTNNVNMGDFTPNIVSTRNHSITKSVLLDQMNLPKIDLIKIDVQGWEKKVLIGANNILKDKPVLIVEFEEHQLSKTNTTCKELFDYIRENNYYIFYLDYDYPSDHICVHNDNLEDFRIKFKQYIFEHTVDNVINHNIQNGVNEKIKF
jgi:FkbM family methyltransferase